MSFEHFAELHEPSHSIGPVEHTRYVYALREAKKLNMNDQEWGIYALAKSFRVQKAVDYAKEKSQKKVWGVSGHIGKLEGRLPTESVNEAVKIAGRFNPDSPKLHVEFTDRFADTYGEYHLGTSGRLFEHLIKTSKQNGAEDVTKVEFLLSPPKSNTFSYLQANRLKEFQEALHSFLIEQMPVEMRRAIEEGSAQIHLLIDEQKGEHPTENIVGRGMTNPITGIVESSRITRIRHDLPATIISHVVALIRTKVKSD